LSPSLSAFASSTAKRMKVPSKEPPPLTCATRDYSLVAAAVVGERGVARGTSSVAEGG
jgi:hypothetical protein